MADQTSAAAQQAAAPNIHVLTQYVRDLSFENPHAPESLVAGWGAPETGVQITLQHKQVQEDTFDVTLHLRVEAKKKDDDKKVFIIDLVYGALVNLRNIPKEHQAPAVMVEVPKLLFPFAREIVASTTARGGYPPLYLAPISFEALYMSEVQRLRQQQAQAGTAGAA